MRLTTCRVSFYSAHLVRNFDFDILNGVLGGGVTARLNMNLCEDKGWTYGAGSGVGDARGPQAVSVPTSIQTDGREPHDIGGTRPNGGGTRPVPAWRGADPVGSVRDQRLG